MKIKGKHWDNTAELTAELKMVVPPLLPTTKHWGFSSFVEEPASYHPLPCGIHLLIVHLLEPPHSAATRRKVEAARGEDGGRNTPSSNSYPIHH